MRPIHLGTTSDIELQFIEAIQEVLSTGRPADQPKAFFSKSPTLLKELRELSAEIAGFLAQNAQVRLGEGPLVTLAKRIRGMDARSFSDASRLAHAFEQSLQAHHIPATSQFENPFEGMKLGPQNK